MREQNALVGDRDDIVVERACGDRLGALLDEQHPVRVEPVLAGDDPARLVVLARGEAAAGVP